MATEKSGYFDLSSDSTYGFTFRFHWSNEYNDTSKCSTLTITKIEVLSTVYSGDWYPGGTITINGETLATMDYNASPNATNIIRVTATSDSTWYNILTYSGLMPVASWSSGSINATTADITVNITLWRDSSTVKPTVTGTKSINLTGSTVVEPEEPEIDKTAERKRRLIAGLALGFLLSKEYVDVRSEPAYLTFSSDQPFTIATYNTTKNWDGTLYYSSNAYTWKEWDGTTALSSSSCNGEQRLYMRGSGNSVITGSSDKYRWVLAGSNIRCDGNIENLLDYETVANGEHPVMTDYCYRYMFYRSGLTTAPELPATTLAKCCYYGMFNYCSGLTTAPALPATTLADYCYSSMFYGCVSLTTAPELPATTLADDCYSYMFNYCSGLTTAPALPATTLAGSCYSNMFSNCTSLTTAPELPATVLVDSCYYCMFQACTSLTTAPALPATTLPPSCYGRMFKGCTSLTTAPAMHATALNGYSIFENRGHCAHMFYGCTSLTTAPALPATTLRQYCYAKMFYGCTNIKLSTTQTDDYQTAYRIPTSGTGATATDALIDMFTGTGGTFTGTPSINTAYYTSNTVV